MVLRLRQTVGNVVLLLGLGMFVLGAGGLAIELLSRSEAVPIAAIALVLVGIGASVKWRTGS